MIGDRLGKWIIKKELGRGGMGRVYLADEAGGTRQAAVKVLSAELAQDAGFLLRFQREIDSLAMLSHPNIVRFFEAGVDNGRFFYAMEYVEGTNLDFLLQAKGRLPWKDVLDVAAQLCPALKHVHDHGIIHRDIKPPNILRSLDGTIKLTDFGIAKVFAHSHLTATGGVVGTAEFLSPEQAAGKPVSKRSDLYSLGVVLYTILTGRTPFEGTSFVDLLHKHRYGQFDRPQKIVPETPPELDDLICQLMEKDPAKRPADCQVLAKQLDSMRRKLERKSQPTAAGLEQDATVAENAPVSTTDVGRPGPATLMSRLMRAELNRQNAGGWLARLFNRAWVVAASLALVTGVLIWTFWPPSPATLFRNGARLMKSTDPVDWDRAWREYLEPLSTHPDYQDEVERFRRKIEDARLQAEFPSEAQRFVLRGERLARDGQTAEARATWQHVKAVFQGMAGEERWVERADKLLAELAQAEETPRRWDSVKAALQRADTLRDAGKRAEAERIWDAVEALYQGEGGKAQDIVKQVQAARKTK